MIEPIRIESNWRAIEIELDAPRATWPERLMRSIGLSPSVTRLMMATPSLRRSWFGALLLVTIAGLGSADATQPGQGMFVMLFLAPLVPLLGVALAYGSAAEPLHEIALAAPIRGIRLVLIRSATVLAIAVPSLALAAIASPADPGRAFAWLLPGLAVSASAIALMTRLTPRRAAAVAAAGWVGYVMAASAITGDNLGAFGPVGQIGSLLLIAFGIFTLVVRHERLDYLVDGE